MRITMIAVGTRGDVQPAIALGKGLQQSGYRVRILAGGNFREWIEGHGLEMAETAVNIQKLMESEGGLEWIERGHNPLVQMRIMKRLLAQYGWQLVQDAWHACQGAEALVSSFLSDAYVTAMAEKLDVPLISMALQPTLMATRDGRVLVNAPLPSRSSMVNLWFGKLLIEPFPWQMLGELTTRLRRELDLPPQSGRENKRIRHRLLTLHCYSRHVVPHPADWPPNLHTTGYWFLDEQADWEPPPELSAFLDAGPAPIYVGFGSMTGRDPAGATSLILDGLAQSGQRAVIATGWAGLGDGRLPGSVFQVESLPHAWLFPRMAAVVHHGGAGTVAAALRAGVPSFVVPHIADQFFWGRRIHQLGVGPRSTPRHKLTAEKLASGIIEAVTDSQMRERAAALGAKIRAEEGTGRAVTLMDEHLRRERQQRERAASS